MATDSGRRVRRQKEIERLGPWFHNLHLPDGTQTAPDHPLGDFPNNKWQHIAPHLPPRLEGWSVLDIGCNSGFYSFALAERGATVFAVDCDPHYLRQAHWAAEQFGLSDRVTFEQMQVYDLAHVPETYDLVWFMGVFYHLRYPTLGLDIAARRTKRELVFQTLTAPEEDTVPPVPDLGLAERNQLNQPGWPKMCFIENRLADDPTNWWVANHAAVLSLLRSAGFRVKLCPAHEVYLCEKSAPPDLGISDHLEQEYLAATGAHRFSATPPEGRSGRE